MLAPDRFSIDRNEYFEGAPTAVVEIRSPEDESYEKLPFYAAPGVPEVWIIDRDSKESELHVLGPEGYRKQAPGADGWLASPGTGVEMRAGHPGKLLLRIAGDAASEQEIP